MDVPTIIAKLEEEFPGKAILRFPEDGPEEIICEAEPTTEHPDHSVAVAYIDVSAPHHHLEGVELYVVEEGTLHLVVEGRTFVLEVGDNLTVQAGQVHSAMGTAARVRVTSYPGWTPDNHVLESSEE